MPPVPILSGWEIVRVFRQFGWICDHQKGSHLVLEKVGNPKNLAVPNHREVKIGTLRGLIRQADLTVQEFVDALKRK